MFRILVDTYGRLMLMQYHISLAVLLPVPVGIYTCAPRLLIWHFLSLYPGRFVYSVVTSLHLKAQVLLDL